MTVITLHSKPCGVKYNMRSLGDFSEIWCVDTEFTQPDGERPIPICLCAQEWRTGREVRWWLADGPPPAPPYDCGSQSLLVAFFVSAELGTHLACGWPLPKFTLDLVAELRVLCNGLTMPSGYSLLSALTLHGIDGMAAVEKESLRDLAIRGAPFSGEERQALLDYCREDVRALVRLLPAMLPRIDLPRALLRARYMGAVAKMEWSGIPIDVERLTLLRESWPSLLRSLVSRVGGLYEGVYDGTTFREEQWRQWTLSHGIPWPQLPSGRLNLQSQTFTDMARAYPIVGPMKELRASLSQLRLEDLAVGRDGRNRTMLSPYRTKTGRNAPSTTKSVLGPATWIRHLIKPEPGYALVSLDWHAQEIGIAACLSHDHAMQQAYRSADIYLHFAAMANAVPSEATKESHGDLRSLYKSVVLGTGYGMRERTLATRIGQSPAHARALLRQHAETFSTFWEWSTRATNHALLTGRIHATFGWQYHVREPISLASLLNWPMQANGSEMMRIAACLATERGVTLAAPLHDAFLVLAPVDELPQAIALTQQSMREASLAVLPGFPLETECQVIPYPGHYRDERGAVMWRIVNETVGCAVAAP